MFLHQPFHIDRFVADRQQSFLDEAERDRLLATSASYRPPRIGTRVAACIEQALQTLMVAERILSVAWARRPRPARREWPAGR